MLKQLISYTYSYIVLTPFSSELLQSNWVITNFDVSLCRALAELKPNTDAYHDNSFVCHAVFINRDRF